MSDARSPSSLPGTLEMTFHPGGDPEISEKMEEWTQRLETEFSGNLSRMRETGGSPDLLPCLTVPGAGQSEISYHFIPEGAEEEAFRELLQRKMGDPEPLETTGTTGPQGVGEPFEILLFVSNQCPNCPRAVRTVHSLALDPTLPGLRVHLFEATQSTELAARHRIRSVPTLLIREEFRFVGPPDPETLSTLFRSGSPAAFLREQVRQQVKEGEAPEAGAKIAEMDDVTFLLEDLAGSTFQERVGWMLAMEEAMESRPDCLAPLVSGLISLLGKAETALRGDLADILGKIGRPEALPALERLLGDENPDVAEAAEDAIEEIRERAD